MSNNLQVKVVADIVDLQTKFATSKAEASALQSEFNKLARASAAGSIDSAGIARYRELATSLTQARVATAGYASELAKAGINANTMTAATHGLHGSLSTATREFRALFDELSSGRTRMTPGTLAIIATRVLGLSPAALAALAGFTALTGGIALFEFESAKAAKQLDVLHTSMLEAGNNVPRAQLQQFTASLAQLPGVSASAGRDILTALGGIHMPFDAMVVAARLAAEEMRRTGEKADKVGESFARALEPARKAVDVAKDIGGLTQAQVDQAKAADASQDANQILAEKLELLALKTARARTAADEYTNSWTQNLSKGIELVSAYVAGGSAGALGEQTSAIQNQATSWKANADAVQAYIASLRQQGSQKLLNFDEVNPAEQLREKMSEVAATWTGSQEELLETQRAMAARMLEQQATGSKAYLDIRREEAQLDVQIRKTTGEQAVEVARNQIAALGSDTALGATARLAAERQVWAQLLSGSQLTAQQRLEVERSYNQASSALTKERAAEAREIQRMDVDNEVTLAKMRLSAERQTLDAQVTAGRVTAAQKLATLRSLAQAEFALDLQRLQAELATLQAGTPDYERVYNQIKVLKEQLNLDLAQLDRQYATEHRAELKEQEKDWTQMVHKIEGAETSFIRGVLSGRQSMTQQLRNLALNLATAEISAAAKAMTERLFLQKSAAAQERVVSAQVGGKTVMQDAAKAFSGTYSSVAQIPYVGWILAPAAAAAAFAAVAAYEGLASLAVGTPYIPQTGLYQLHEGEAVMPKTWAQGMRDGDVPGDRAVGDTHNYGGIGTLNVGYPGIHEMLSRPAGTRSVLQAAAAAYGRGWRG